LWIAGPLVGYGVVKLVLSLVELSASANSRVDVALRRAARSARARTAVLARRWPGYSRTAARRPVATCPAAGVAAATGRAVGRRVEHGPRRRGRAPTAHQEVAVVPLSTGFIS
jgi:hypothetical protein